MSRDKNPGIPGPATIPMSVPILGGTGKKQMNIPDAVQLLMQQMGNVLSGLEQLTNANNTMAMELELIKTRVTALEAKITLIPENINVVVTNTPSYLTPTNAPLPYEGEEVK